MRVQAAFVSAESEGAHANTSALGAHTPRLLQPKDALEHSLVFFSFPK